MSNYYGGGPAQPNPGLQFYQSNYAQPVSGHATPSQASYGYGGPSSGGFGSSFTSGFAGAPGVSGRMDEQGGLRTGWLAAFSTEGYDGEPPLLEELGVSFTKIQRKTFAVLNPFSRVDQHLMDDSDLAGPVLFFFLFGTFLMLSGSVHFGFIYGLAVLGSVSLHTILSLMAPPVDPSTAVPSAPGQSSYPGAPVHHHSQSQSGATTTLTFARSASVLGYCLLPLVATSLVGIVMPMATPFGIFLTTLAVLWSSYAASGIFCSVGGMNRQRFLVAYPLALFYVGFGIMGVFSSRGGKAGKA
ncbi:hypothetical protein QC763_403360 [Podospora pseudopauciseta]|uniref:Protein YIP n=2 Tax=Podospora TaxID=5144 RepID=A0ABR0HCZ9_9PEZI|nr:hypothetical protein QC763_403360 [Podospora pseudopauciseta]KAK4676913.1 hypothetical protein QC764_403360 [Podospora pseudoanserina]